MRRTIKQQFGSEAIASGIADVAVREFEGGWYFAPEAVNMQYLKVTNRTYTCPYKGVCFWIDLEEPGARVTNIAWVYQNPNPATNSSKTGLAFTRGIHQQLLPFRSRNKSICTLRREGNSDGYLDEALEALPCSPTG